MRWTRAFTAKTYPVREGLGVGWRNLVGPSRANPAGVGFVPQQTQLNDITPQLTLGFGGDVMSMFNRPLRFHPSVTDFFADCNHVLVNFEGVITDEKQISPDQKHTRPIIDALKQMADPSRLVLSLANNHTGDFGEAACRDSVRLLHDEGLATFGMSETPFIDLGESVRVVTGTQWSNRTGSHLTWLREPEQHLRAGAFNVLYPHWGFELEVYPRVAQVQSVRDWLTSFDAVVGHHSHTPQPITVESSADDVRKLAAYSLGDMCFGLAYKNIHPLKYYVWGLLARATVGPLKSDPQRWAVGELNWSFMECHQLSRPEGFEVRLVDQIPLFDPMPSAKV
jgi:hypothetical protein